MKILFLVGVEGCGHHMIRAILHNFLQREDVIDEGLWHRILRTQNDYHLDPKPNRLFRSRSKNDWLKQGKKINKTIDDMLSEYNRQGVSYLFESASYPYGNPRNPLRRFDLLNFIDLFHPKVDVRILSLYRNPISMVYSAYRREITRNLMLQAKIVEDNLIFLNSQLGLCSEELFKTIVFEEFLIDPIKYTKALSQWWGIDLSELKEGIQALRKPTQIQDIPNKFRDPLECYFSERRNKQWPIFTADRSNLIRYEE